MFLEISKNWNGRYQEALIFVDDTGMINCEYLWNCWMLGTNVVYIKAKKDLL
mgnify:CR=1 FL=1